MAALDLTQKQAEPISSASTEELLRCLNCEESRDECRFDQVAVIWELLNRKESDLLIKAFKESRDACQRSTIVRLLHSIADESDNPKIARFMPTVPTDALEEQDFYALLYRAERGNRQALSTLNRNYFKYGVSSVEWAEAVIAFGKHKYRPAVCNIIGDLHAASFNLVDAAEESLRQFFPDAPKQFNSLEELQAYFQERGQKLKPPCQR